MALFIPEMHLPDAPVFFLLILFYFGHYLVFQNKELMPIAKKICQNVYILILPECGIIYFNHVYCVLQLSCQPPQKVAYLQTFTGKISPR